MPRENSLFITSPLLNPDQVRLSREREVELARLWFHHSDTAARDDLVRGSLWAVAIHARRFARQGAARDDLVAEGNCGLLHALSKFDPDRGVRFATYARYWISSYMVIHLVKTRSMVSSGVHSKTLGTLRRERARAAGSVGIGQEADALAARNMKLSPHRLQALLLRLEVQDVALDLDSSPVLHSREENQEEQLATLRSQHKTRVAVAGALQILDERERYVVEKRKMASSEDELSLAQIGRNLGVSRERVRQLEARALRKIGANLKGVRDLEAQA